MYYLNSSRSLSRYSGMAVAPFFSPLGEQISIGRHGTMASAGLYKARQLFSAPRGSFCFTHSLFRMKQKRRNGGYLPKFFVSYNIYNRHNHLFLGRWREEKKSRFQRESRKNRDFRNLGLKIKKRPIFIHEYIIYITYSYLESCMLYLETI